MIESSLQRFLITFTVITASILELIDTTIVNVSLPVIGGELGATLSELSWVVAGYALANAVVVPITGWLGGTFGRRRYFAGSILLFTFASFMCGHSVSIDELVVWRIVQGVGGGALLATSQAILVDSYPPEQLGFANAMFGIGAVVGPTFGPVLGGWLTDNYSWQWIFFVNVPIGILATILTLTYVPEPPEEHRHRGGKLDWPGLLFLLVGLGSLQTFLERGHDEDWFSTGYIRWLAVAAVAGLIAFVVWELHTKHPIVNLRVLARRSTGIGTFLLFMLGFGLYVPLFIYPVYVQHLVGYSPMQTGLSLMPSGLASLAVLPFIGIALRKGVSIRLAAGVGFVLCGIFCLLFTGMSLQSGGDPFDGSFAVPLLVRGVGVALLFVPLTTIAMSGLKGPDVGQASGLTNMSRQLGGSVGVALAATVLDDRMQYHRVHLVSHLSAFSGATQVRVHEVTQAFVASGATLYDAKQQALAALNGIVMKNAALMSYMDLFFYIGLFFLICVPIVFLVPRVEGGPAMPAH